MNMMIPSIRSTGHNSVIRQCLCFTDRSETARLLLELNAPIGVSDNQGQKAITWMITKMAPVVSIAMYEWLWVKTELSAAT